MNREKMLAPLAEEEIHTFEGRGGKTFTYIEDETVMDRLDAGYGPGNWQIAVEASDAVVGVVKVRLGVRELAGWVWYEDFGYATREGGEVLKEAVSDGIRRCGRYVGIARDLYRKATYEPGGSRERRAPDPDPSRVDRSTGEVREPTPLRPKEGETETLLADTTRTGRIARGSGVLSDLQWRDSPDGHIIRFRLDLAGKDDKGNPRSLSQVWVPGELGETLFAAGIDPDKLLGKRAACTGPVYEVTQPGRGTYYRMKVTRLEVDGLPAVDIRVPVTMPPEADPDGAELDAIGETLPWPDSLPLAPA